MDKSVPPPELDDEAKMKRISRRSFCWAALAVGGTYFAFNRLHAASTNKNGQWQPDGPMRDVLRIDDTLSERYFSTTRLSPTYADSAITEARVNEKIGAVDDFDPETWTIAVQGLDGKRDAELTLADIRKLKPLEYVSQFKCIEGWNFFMKWGGVSMASFIEKYKPRPDAKYVCLETIADGDENGSTYYVSIDMPAAVHPQTMLCMTMNGKPLTTDHGAPIRLIIPHKYGVKNIKQIAVIRYTKDLPHDYWAELGYDEYCGL
jgi:DMSO/TMAO reductase YedYZ molybdopterin-dependent catalytic subunit